MLKDLRDNRRQDKTILYFFFAVKHCSERMCSGTYAFCQKLCTLCEKLISGYDVAYEEIETGFKIQCCL